MPPKYTVNKKQRALATEVRNASMRKKDFIKLLSDEYEVIQSTQIERLYKENDGDEAAIRATLNAKLEEYKLWFRSPKRAGEKRTAVEQEVEGTKNLLKRAKAVQREGAAGMVAGLIGSISGVALEQQALSDRIAALTATHNQLLTIGAPTPTPPATTPSTRSNTPDPLDELLNLPAKETNEEDE
ncbi:hypothetical protein HK097_006281 [Rhizophlyctis rosea]|uniref:Uncharacterized protein n=1 Tax=Rhizophlyctis rosea TaxID=64517 RepID=A0AAD5X266_9FUNG|nr:hypothetical protein HK097_006281 [Rhizophlyctis rosea]